MELELLRQISEFGILGVILALVWWIALRLWRDLQASWHERLVENKHVVSVIETTNRSYEALAAATENRAKANELMSQAQSATSQALESQIKALDKVVATSERVYRSVDKLTMQLERLRHDLGAGQQAFGEQRRPRGQSK